MEMAPIYYAFAESRCNPQERSNRINKGANHRLSTYCKCKMFASRFGV